ncbi:hypothetical protein PENANT_c024G03724 [Penicillium antarcticum]|uniref:Uncharacterized protein n=1 Tax=Penicillium antarcticum TaxID=416450 RepID=A0A1V6PZ71_9EURO|nr:uncharacterized protein N7508_005115 [Penicillium antarcticum]KAJ5306100.1 hypothetical protein N7508_005115 [Penicillium antarcticum]OQD82012.1 hypothetical protein PENANT_c024G03724 [Penicillium antarcticum]
MTITSNNHTSAWKCEQCGLPGVRVSTGSGRNSSAHYKCVPCNRSLGPCPCTTPGAYTTSTCPCGASKADSPGLEEVPRGVSMLAPRKGSLNPHNPDNGFDEDWEANCKPGYMVSRFKAEGHELLWP